MPKFLKSATFIGGITIATYDGPTPRAVVYKTQDGDSEQRRRSDVLEIHKFASRAEMRRFVAGYEPAREAR